MEMVLLTALGVGGATVIGALIGFIFKKISHKFSDIVLAFAAGVMLAAAVLGLIIPSVEHGKSFGTPIALLMTCGGVFAGALCLNLVDKLVPHLHKLAGVEDPQRKRQIIGAEFGYVFLDEAVKFGITKADFFAQGTIYPDVIESGEGEAAVIGGGLAAALGIAQDRGAGFASGQAAQHAGEEAGRNRIVVMHAHIVLAQHAAPVVGFHGIPCALGDDHGRARIALGNEL